MRHWYHANSRGHDNVRPFRTAQLVGLAFAITLAMAHVAALSVDVSLAATLFRASIGHGGGFGGSVTLSGTTPQDLPYQTVAGGLNVIASGSARADRGQLELIADDLGTQGPQQDQWSASSHFRAEDVVITGPQGVTQVASSINLVVDGEFLLVRPNGETATASLDLIADAFVAFQTLHWDAAIGSTPVQEAIVVDSGTYPVGTAIPAFELTLNAQTAMTAPSCCAHALVDVQNGSHGVHFPVGSPVFNLPPGFTVNSPTLSIVDNIWLGSATSVANAAPPGSIVEFVGRPGNPESAAFRLSLTEAAEIRLTLVDVEGRSVGVLAHQFAPAGVHDYALDAIAREPLASGMYFGVLDVRSAGTVARRSARLAIIR